MHRKPATPASPKCAQQEPTLLTQNDMWCQINSNHDFEWLKCNLTWCSSGGEGALKTSLPDIHRYFTVTACSAWRHHHALPLERHHHMSSASLLKTNPWSTMPPLVHLIESMPTNWTLRDCHTVYMTDTLYNYIDLNTSFLRLMSAHAQTRPSKPTS